MSLELLEHVQARARLSLPLQSLVQFTSNSPKLLLQLSQTHLPLFNSAPLRLDGYLFRFHTCRKILEPGLQARAFFFKLDLLGGEFFEPDNVTLAVEIKGVYLVSQPAQFLSRREYRRLGLAHRLLPLAELVFYAPKAILFGGEGRPMLRERPFGCTQPLDHCTQFELGGATALLRLRHFTERLGILGSQFPKAFFIEVDPTFVAVNFTL